MQHPQTDKTGSTQSNAVTYVVDCDSGWEMDDDVFWIIDEANEAEWENQVPYILD